MGYGWGNVGAPEPRKPKQANLGRKFAPRKRADWAKRVSLQSVEVGHSKEEEELTFPKIMALVYFIGKKAATPYMLFW